VHSPERELEIERSRRRNYGPWWAWLIFVAVIGLGVGVYLWANRPRERFTAVTSGPTTVTTSRQAATSTTTTRPTTTTANAFSGRTGSFVATSKDGDKAKVTVEVGQTTNADQVSADGPSLATLCGLDGMARTKASATPVKVTVQLESSEPIETWPKFIPLDRHEEYLAVKWKDGWDCRNAARSVIGWPAKLSAGQTHTLHGWWIKEDANASTDFKVQASFEWEQFAGSNNQSIANVTGPAFESCRTSTYLVLSGPGC
jgi:hypothetical protein